MVLAVLVSGCSRKNDTFLSRNFHAVTAEYNTLYNGEVAFDEGRDALINTYTDNFWEILPVERLEKFEEVTLPGESKNPNFERAEEKAIKAIQKHSMEIDGKERNPQIDEAFMLLGKGRYYDQRFIRAQEAFNYILSYYPASNNIAQAKIWKEKTNIRLSNNEVAIENLTKLLEEEDELDDQDYADASAMLAQAFINVDQKDSAVVKIAAAARFTPKNEERGRYLFIKGQLYDALNKKDSANLAYDEVIELNRKSPRRYMINAYIAKAKNFDYTTEDRLAFFETLKELEENRENRPYLDLIYNQLGEYYLNVEEQDSAKMYYNFSLRTPTQDRYLISRNYLSLGNMNFDNSEYSLAGAYYDSTLGNLEERTREYRDINKKRENLNDVIRYEQVAKQNDSILRVVAMSEDERQAYFQQYIYEIKEKDKLDSIAIESSAVRNNEFFISDAKQTPEPGAIFYFYNPTAVAQGKLRFESRWGKRELADNWRISSQRANVLNEIQEESDSAAVAVENLRYNIDTYINSVPTKTESIDSLVRDRDFAYYQLGLIYKEKFKEYGLASDRLENLLENEPEERLVLPSKYYLYQIYGESGNNEKQNQYRQDILNNYPDTRYASIIRNPNEALQRDEDSPESLYNQLYRKFEEQEYNYVINKADEYIDKFTGDGFVPKFVLLKATALGRFKGFEPYKEALNYVALNYPDKDEGKKAQAILENQIPQIQNSDFETGADAYRWKLIYEYPLNDKEQLQKDKERLTKALEDYFYTQYYFSSDVYDENERLLVIHGFDSEGAALSVAEKLNSDKKIKWNKKGKVISSDNYRIVQIHKNLEAYLNKDTN